MPRVTFIDFEGNSSTVDAASGQSLMQVASDNMIEGILAECGGACACATCHCYIEPNWQATVGEADEMEAGMLEQTLAPQSNSRLACQITLGHELDGLVVRLSEKQY